MDNISRAYITDIFKEGDAGDWVLEFSGGGCLRVGHGREHQFLFDLGLFIQDRYEQIKTQVNVCRLLAFFSQVIRERNREEEEEEEDEEEKVETKGQ